MLRQYLYVSTAPDLRRDEISAIIASCESNNAEHGITGLLIYNGRNFLQLLEGAEKDLLWVMRRISGDVRHSGISVLEDTVIDERTCTDWHIRHIRFEDSVEDQREGVGTELRNGRASCRERTKNSVFAVAFK